MKRSTKHTSYVFPTPPPKKNRVYPDFLEEHSKKRVIGARLFLPYNGSKDTGSVQLVKRAQQKSPPATSRIEHGYFNILNDRKSKKYTQLRINLTQKTPLERAFSDFEDLFQVYSAEEQEEASRLMEKAKKEVEPSLMCSFLNQEMQPLVYFSHWALSRRWCIVYYDKEVGTNSYLSSSTYPGAISRYYPEGDFCLSHFLSTLPSFVDKRLPVDNFVMITPITGGTPRDEDVVFSGVDFILMFLIIFSLQGLQLQSKGFSFPVNELSMLDVTHLRHPLPAFGLEEFLSFAMPQAPPGHAPSASPFSAFLPPSAPIPIPVSSPPRNQALITTFFPSSSPLSPSLIDSKEEETPRMRSPEIFYCEEEIINSPPSLGSLASLATGEELPQLFHLHCSSGLVSCPSPTGFETEEQWMMGQLDDPWIQENVVVQLEQEPGEETGLTLDSLERELLLAPSESSSSSSAAFSAHLEIMGFSSPYPLSPLFFGSPEGILVGGGAM